MPFEPWKEETPDAVQQEEAPPEPVAPEPEVEAPKAETVPEPPPKAPEPSEPKAKPYNESVPYERFREVLGRQREAEARLEEAMARLKALETPKAPEPKVPDYAEDPVEHLRVKQELAERQLSEMREREEAFTRERQALEQRERFVSWYRSQAEDFGKAQADFGDAYKHAIGRMRDLILPAAVDPAAVGGVLEQWEAGIVMRAAQEGRNPAQALYEIARSLGYAPPAAAPAAQAAEEKVAAIAEARERSKSLGPSRAAEPAGEADDDDMGGLKTLFEAQSEMGLRRRR